MKRVRPYAPIHWHIRAFRPSLRVDVARAWLVVVVLRLFLALGFVVLLIGRARSGKTYLLERTTPGRIVDGSAWQEPSGRSRLTANQIPSGHFSIDNLERFAPSSIYGFVETFASRSFICAAQTHKTIDKAAFASWLRAIGRRIFVVTLDYQER